ncbi:FMN-dependent NADH-azoreductase [Marinobacterium rhizophilum]|uniref:FMN dependent NADH:quinone oxidoreductase n=1 Tax=Marinobacterium rhizophilum TaxID=420402 RepID=A0ABY5HLP3_9GAMM|nr:NAD(P)H-dependent oxidoreductase [Marinobacterium rhizophilum]UTW13306.1 NAD(P)H-dependent oxidoreductase [Marinobacterium rhizophilum]
MTKVLVIQSSALNETSNTRLLTTKLLARLGRDAQIAVTTRDLAQDQLPHITDQTLGAFFTPADQRSDEQNAIIALSDTLVGELMDTDILIIAAPMYNFGVPSTLKAYFDHIARAGVTFKYTETGPVGLVQNKQAYIVTATGGIHAGTPRDFVAPYVETFLGFIGINAVETFAAEGMSMPDMKDQSLNQVMSAIEQL